MLSRANSLTHIVLFSTLVAPLSGCAAATETNEEPPSETSEAALGTSTPFDLPWADQRGDRKVMIVIYDPPTSAGVPISRVENWNDPKVLSDGLVAALRQSSHGQMRFAIVGQPIVITNNLPAWDNDGTVDTADKLVALQNAALRDDQATLKALDKPCRQYSGGCYWNHDTILRDPRMDIAGKINRGEIDEVWIWAPPYAGFDEYRMVGPGAYDIPFGTSLVQRRFMLMAFNATRPLALALHSFGHRAESILGHLYTTDSRRLWGRFSGTAYTNSIGGVGDVHHPVNVPREADYRYSDTNAVRSNASGWIAQPFSNPDSATSAISCDAGSGGWGCSTDKNIAQENYLRWWFAHMPFGQAGAPNWWTYISAFAEFADTPSDPEPPSQGDMVAVQMQGTASGRTEVLALSRSSNFQRVRGHFATPLPSLPPSSFACTTGLYTGDSTPDLFTIGMNGTATGTTEVHVFSGSDGFQRAAIETPTPLGPTNPNSFAFLAGDWNRDGIADLIAVKMNGTPGNKVEVHILDGRSKFQRWLLHTSTPLAATSAANSTFGVGDYDRDGKLDLFLILMNGTGSNTTEVHVLSGASTFQSFVLQTGTALGLTDAGHWSFVVRDVNSDGAVDVVAFAQFVGTGTHSTEVHALSGASRYTSFVLQTGTALRETAPAQWKLSL